MSDRMAGRPTAPEVVRELDRFIIGQGRAKRAVAIALRNRWRRRAAREEIRDEILPNNILMIGPTGVGKTEISRRLARVARAPFLKVEASKFTEVGYVGRDVESMVRDLVEVGINEVEREMRDGAEPDARRRADERLLRMLEREKREDAPPDDGNVITVDAAGVAERPAPAEAEEKEKSPLERLRAGEWDDREVDVEIAEKGTPLFDIFAASGMNQVDRSVQDSLGSLFPKKKRTSRVTVREARRILLDQELDGLVDRERAVEEGKRRVEEAGIVFLDEIDKIAGGGNDHGPDVSREGVQRDLLPVVEGSRVPTKYGLVSTEHVLFIGAGAFHQNRPSDLIPELQGRFPIRVELDSLTAGDFFRILTEPENALVKQYTAMMESESVTLRFDEDALREIARIAELVNERTENIGARRLHTLLSTLLEDILYEVPETERKEFTIDEEMVRERLGAVAEDGDLSRYIL